MLDVKKRKIALNKLYILRSIWSYSASVPRNRMVLSLNRGQNAALGFCADLFHWTKLYKDTQVLSISTPSRNREGGGVG